MNPQNNILFLWEDDEDIVKMFSLFLQEHGYLMESVNSFDECVEYCRNKPPALLIMRSFVDKPRDGLGFVLKLKSDLSISYFPIIMGWADFTYDSTEEGYKEAFEAGANACFGRVFDITDVLEQIEILFNDPMTTGIVDRQTMRIQKRESRKD